MSGTVYIIIYVHVHVHIHIIIHVRIGYVIPLVLYQVYTCMITKPEGLRPEDEVIISLILHTSMHDIHVTTHDFKVMFIQLNEDISNHSARL